MFKIYCIGSVKDVKNLPTPRAIKHPEERIIKYLAQVLIHVKSIIIYNDYFI